jgi:serine/threonine-protein kinase
MEFVEGRSLKELIGDRAPFTVAEAFAIGQQVASALDFAHKRGLVHRDVKPQNIMVSPEGVAKVTDFGIARSISASQLTRPGMVIGTVHYFSPEQAQGKPAIPASDIYSLGVILYEMLTGHLPFDAETAIGVAMQHLHSQPPPPWEYNPSLPTRAVATVLRALEKEPERRYRDAAEFAGALADRPGQDMGMTTVAPIVELSRQHTAALPRVEPQMGPSRRRSAGASALSGAVSTRMPEAANPNRWRTAWIALGAVGLAAAIGLASFFITRNVLGSGATPTPTRTPTSTPSPTPKPTRTPRPKPTATQPVLILPTYTPTLVPPTDTPQPTATLLAPTATTQPATPTSAPVIDTPTATAALPTPTSTAEG